MDKEEGSPEPGGNECYGPIKNYYGEATYDLNQEIVKNFSPNSYRSSIE